jgi:hypothetical protein
MGAFDRVSAVNPRMGWAWLSEIGVRKSKSHFVSMPSPVEPIDTLI